VLAEQREIGQSVRVSTTDEGAARTLRPGVRVKVVRDPRWAGPWPAEPLGIIEPIFGEASHVVSGGIPSDWPRRADGTLHEFMVLFDEPQRDGDGDGPYPAALIWETYLLPIGEGEVDYGPDAQDRRSRLDKALRAVMEHPEVGERRTGQPYT
jgi:hypothetical protein